jgi:N-acetylglucosaminyldiphosphoundecaprenol N-acetyl-beta-D-mannosaminyltransferase
LRRPLTIFGVTATDQTFDEALETLDLALKSNHCHTVVFPNAATLNLAAENPEFRETLNSATHVFGDGTGVRWAARARGLQVQANLNGTDLIPAFLDRHDGLRVFLLGGKPEYIEATKAGFKARFPRIELVGMHNGYFNHLDCQDVIDDIGRAKPDLLLVGFGNPLQENWLCRYKNQLPVSLAAGVGGLFSYWAGTLDRAPSLYRKFGMEWAHLLLSQPHKAKRYLLGNPLFFARVFMHLSKDKAQDSALISAWNKRLAETQS